MLQIPSYLSAKAGEIVARDFGDDASVTRWFLGAVQGGFGAEVRGVVYEYAGDKLIDTYRQSRSSFGYSSKRTEIEKGEALLEAPRLDFISASPGSFMVAMHRANNDESLRRKLKTAYVVRSDTGVKLGYVARAEFDANEVGDKPRVQWLAVTTEGEFWSSFGRTREQAARYLLAMHYDPNQTF